MGKNTAQLILDIYVLSQDDYCNRKSELFARAKNSKDSWVHIASSRTLRSSFFYGMSMVIAPLDINDFIKNARLTERKAKPIRRVYGVVCNFFQYISKLDPEKWSDCYEPWIKSINWFSMLMELCSDLRDLYALLHNKEPLIDGKPNANQV